MKKSTVHCKELVLHGSFQEPSHGPPAGLQWWYEVLGRPYHPSLEPTLRHCAAAVQTYAVERRRRSLCAAKAATAQTIEYLERTDTAVAEQPNEF